GRVVAHLGEGATPETVNLWRNRQGNGLDIQRANVTVEGISFRNYNGSRQARAVTVRGANVTLRKLEIENCVRGIVVSAPDARVEACVLRGVGQGIAGTSVNLTISDCVIES